MKIDNSLYARQSLLDNNIDKLNNIMAVDYAIVWEHLKRDIEDLYLTIIQENKDGQVLVSHLYQYRKYYETLNKIDEELTKLGNKQIRQLGQYLEDQYIETSNLVGKAFNLSVDLNPEKVREAINQYWTVDEKSWSDRIWTNKDKLAEQLRQGLIETITTGKPHADISQVIANKFNTSFHNAERLVRTELIHIEALSTLDRYKEMGIKQVKIIGADDCCDLCKEYVNKVYEIDKVPILPIHPQCRCCYVAVVM